MMTSPDIITSTNNNNNSHDDGPSNDDALPTPCDDSSYFDGEWMSRTVHEAMSHCSFFAGLEDATETSLDANPSNSHRNVSVHAPVHVPAHAHVTSSSPLRRTRSLSPTSLSHSLPLTSPDDAWTSALERCRPSLPDALGAAVLTAAVVVSPLGFWGGAAAASAATTAWAVGRLHGGERGGYFQIWGGEEFARLFWMDPPTAGKRGAGCLEGGDQEEDGDREEGRDVLLDSIATETTTGDDDAVEVTRIAVETREHARETPREISIESPSPVGIVQLADSVRPLLGRPPPSSSRSSSSRLRRIRSAPISTAASPRRPPPGAAPPSLSPLPALSSAPLETEVVRDVVFPGLRPDEFFRVFFADDAPYSMKEFQTQQGDVDVVYGPWKEADRNGLDSEEGAPIPVLERTLRFRTLTKSYFGPAYAHATKVQRAVRRSDRRLVIESETSLADIPYADRFRVAERWIAQDASLDDRHGDGTTRPATTLAVRARVVMLGSCPFESQIRKKASQTLEGTVTEWCRAAREALRATDEGTRRRWRESSEGEAPSLASSDASTSSSNRPMMESTIVEERRRRTSEELDDLIERGDLEWCSVEVAHSPETSTVVGATPDVVTRADDAVEVSVAMEEKDRAEPRRGVGRGKFLRRISSKVSRSRRKSR